ncbi:helix-turn-helix domain-containing protein [Pseudoruegeria sp. HB172150]|uniref:helix-turn-helix domain-containing protein n=1 Tax=Pseudoruegeria sp. HB172150 TaxID=2721164 RepID=UPI001C131870|nr:helix-turn-helix domain-containing protein [Pseudoruegeria sp. HB172150]
MSNKDGSIIAALKACQRKDKLTQAELATALGIHQAHLSKVMAGKAPLSSKLRARAERLLQSGEASNALIEDLEVELIQALRSSKDFRALIRAAMQLHRTRISDTAGSD